MKTADNLFDKHRQQPIPAETALGALGAVADCGEGALERV